MQESHEVFMSIAGLRFKQIKNLPVYDKNNEKLGKLQDVIFKYSENGCKLVKFVIGGSFFEELAESLGLRPDIDPIFSVDNIKLVTNNKIVLNVAKDELKSTHIDKDAISEDEIKLSKLENIKIYDANEIEVGSIIDLKFHDGSFKFIIGDGFFKESLETIGLRDDIDFLLSPEYISNVNNDKIVLKKTQQDMQVIFEENILPDYKKAINETKNKAMNFYFPQ